MAKRIGYGRLAEIPSLPKTKVPRAPRLRNQLSAGLESYMRDPEGNCFKAVIGKFSFVWIEINPSEFEAANESKA